MNKVKYLGISEAHDWLRNENIFIHKQTLEISDYKNNEITEAKYDSVMSINRQCEKIKFVLGNNRLFDFKIKHVYLNTKKIDYLQDDLKYTITIDNTTKLDKLRITIYYFFSPSISEVNEQRLKNTNTYLDLKIEELWYPIFNFDYNKFCLVICVDKGINLFFSGKILSMSETSKSTIYKCELMRKNYPLLITGNFNNRTEKTWWGEISINFTSELTIVEDILFYSKKILSTATRYFGNVPFERVEIIVLTNNKYTTASNANHLIILSLSNNQQDLHQVLLTLCHEFIHIWYGSTVCNNYFNDRWINEGVAEFIGLLIFTKIFKEYKIENFMKEYLVEINKCNWNYVPSLSKIDIFHPMDEVSTYLIGSLIFYSLYKNIGKNSFQYLVREFYKEHKLLVYDTKDFYYHLNQLFPDLNLRFLERLLFSNTNEIIKYLL
jgi:hypothetical protein